jgi:hypothetical protein
VSIIAGVQSNSRRLPSSSGQARNFMGLKRLILGFYRTPDLVHEMMDFWCDPNEKIQEDTRTPLPLSPA